MTLALSQLFKSEDTEEAAVATPDYFKVGNALSLANGNGELSSASVSTEEDDSYTDPLDYAAKFITTSIVAGVNELTNIPANVANMFGADIETTTTEDALASMGSDMSQFYADNKAGVDVAGFILSSIVPGMAGIKVLNLGQKSLVAALEAGKFGESTAKSLRLLTPMKEHYMAKAVSEALNGTSVSALTNRNALKAMASGLGQNVLEAAAFEVAVATTMYNSPVLENQDLGDFISNIAFSAGVFGLAGGVLDAARIGYKVKGAANQAELEARPWKFIPEQAAASNSYEKVLLDFDTLHTMPPVPAGLTIERTEYLKQAAAAKTRQLEDRIRKEFGNIAEGDQDVAELLFNTFKGEQFATKNEAFVGLLHMGRVHSKSRHEVLRANDAFLKKHAAGKATLEETEAYLNSSVHSTYTKLWGEGAGKSSMDVPKVTALADVLKKGERIEVAVNQRGRTYSGAVTAGKSKAYNFSTNYNVNLKADAKKHAPFNILEADPLKAQARYIWVSKLPKLEVSSDKPFRVHTNDIPMMEKVARDLGDTPELLQYVKFEGPGTKAATGSIHDFVGAKKYELAMKMLKRQAPMSQEEIAAVVNVKSASLTQHTATATGSKFAKEDIYAMQDHMEKYTAQQIEKGFWKEDAGLIELWKQPQHIKMTYDTAPFAGVDNNLIDQMAIIKEQQKLYQESTAKASAGVLGKFFDMLPDMSSGRVYKGADLSGAGAGYVHAASSDYGTIGAVVERSGQVVSMATEEAKKATRSVLEPLLYKVVNKTEATLEWSVLNSKVRGLQGTYGLNEAGDALEPLAMIKWRRMAAEANAKGTEVPKQPKFAEDTEMLIPIQNKEVRDLIKGHIELNGKRTVSMAELRTAQGQKFARDPEAFYPIPVNHRDFPYYAFVTDSTITSGNHTGMIYAATADELQRYISVAKQNPHFNVITGKEAERYFDARGRWDYEKTLGDNYINSELKRIGTSRNVNPSTDPQKIADEMLNWHMDREYGLVREAVTAKYEVQFEELKRLGEEYSNAATSKFGTNNISKFFTGAVSNPYEDIVNTALNVKKTESYPWHVNINKLADDRFSAMYRKIDELFGSSKSTKTPEQYAEITATMRKYGYTGAAYNEQMALFANATVPRNKLTELVSKANGLLATVVLRWDALNAVNNAVSANVLLGTETNSLVRLINSGDAVAKQEFNALTRINVPGSEHTVFSSQKLIANAMKNFNAAGKDFKWYEDNGFMTSISRQYRDNFDSISFNPADSFGGWESKLNKLSEKLQAAGDFGEKWTGNKLAEEFNRFVAADVMKQMTDVAIKRGLMDTKEQLAYINTFVNRTQGNYLASQRPMMFHGPIGQAIGLFQTYQFNLLQQLLRHVGEGRGKDAMTLIGLQGTIHGMNGLPAFNAINTSILGNASGNPDHKDMFDTVYGIAGKQGGDWLMYGLASNMLGLIDPDLKINLYTRGDINPRHLTIVPTDPSQVPIVQASARFVSNLVETGKKLSAGGDVVGTILQGVEHNGISRPLAGLAQVLEAYNNPEKASYSTSSRGNVVFANDLLSFVNATRLVGGKPLDEAIATDAMFRYKAYDLKDQARRNILGEAIKTTMQAGNMPTAEQMQEFQTKYVESGGKQDQFNKWALSLYKGANLSQVSQIQDDLGSRYSQSMQLLMGGRNIRDFTDPKRKLTSIPLDNSGENVIEDTGTE